MGSELSLLVVDISKRGERVASNPAQRTILRYPHGTLGEGFNAISEVVHHAAEVGIVTYAVWFVPPWHRKIPHFNEEDYKLSGALARHIAKAPESL